MPIVTFIFIFLGLFSAELVYFKVARIYNIVDKPNERSSHSIATIRGGGIIFPISTILFYFFFGFQYSFFLTGLAIISLVSFLDDLHALNNRVRLTCHLTAVLFLFLQWGLFQLPWYWILPALIFVVGTINAYNFMDGINGITGTYSLLAVATLYFLNERIQFTSDYLLVITALSLGVFGYFNFRKRAFCFAGDVGSVGIAFLLVFLIGQVIILTGNLTYIFLILIYGLDVITTVFFRLLRRENIFLAHRSHFYQYLANERKWDHRMICSAYCLMQATVNFSFFYLDLSEFYALIAAILIGGIFLGIRFAIEGSVRLLGKKS